jgi:type VI secretion system secreted protein VgrG
MSTHFSVAVTLSALSGIKSKDDLQGLLALHTIVNGDPDSAGGDRHSHGVVRRFEDIGRDGRFHLYDVELIPALWRLSLRRNCRIFRNMQTHVIVATILKEGRITFDRFSFSHSNKNRLRKFSVQYREIDLDFVSRLLQDDVSSDIQSAWPCGNYQQCL